MKYFTERIPVWALSALINADYSGLTDEDIALVENWLAETQYDVVCCPNDEDTAYFSHYPAFGLATDVIDLICF